MLEAKESCLAVTFASVSREGLTHEIPAKLSAWRIFKCDFFTLHPYCIYIPSLPTNYKEAIQRKKIQIRFLQHTPILQRECYSSLVKNHCSIFSFLLLVSYLERRFVPKHNPHLFNVQSVLELGKFWGFAKKNRLELVDAIGRIARSKKLEKT